MNVERIAEEYVKQNTLLKSLEKIVGEYKKLLIKVVDEQGEPDAKGHRWFVAGSFLLQRQKRQGDKYINKERAEEWAKERGIWNKVSVTVEQLDEDALVAYAYEHRSDEMLEKEFQALYDQPPVTYAFMPPVVEAPIDY